jgi:hypothetical protein
METSQLTLAGLRRFGFELLDLSRFRSSQSRDEELASIPDGVG